MIALHMRVCMLACLLTVNFEMSAFKRVSQVLNLYHSLWSHFPYKQ